MREDQIPEFVTDVIASGCNIEALGDSMYFIGDADLPAEDYERIAPELAQIDRKYGPRDHLRLQIIEYLRSIGRHSTIDDLVEQARHRPSTQDREPSR